MIKNITNIGKGLWSLLVGLKITGKYAASPHVTTYYPREVIEPEATQSFRGPIELVGSPKDPATPKCISCMLCVQACPSGCISVKKSPAPVMTPEQQKEFDEATARGENPKKPAAPKNPAVYEYDFTYCSLCACCVEACPVNSIQFSNEIYLAGHRREDFKMDLLARLKRLAAEGRAPGMAKKAAKPEAAVEAPAKPAQTEQTPAKEASA